MRSAIDAIENRKALRRAIEIEKNDVCTDEMLDKVILTRDGKIGMTYGQRVIRSKRLVRWVIPGAFVPFLLNLSELLIRYDTNNIYFSVDRKIFETVTYGVHHTMTLATIDRQWQRWKLKIEQTGLGFRIQRHSQSSMNRSDDSVRHQVTSMVIEPQLIRDVVDEIMIEKTRPRSKVREQAEDRREQAALLRLRRKCG